LEELGFSGPPTTPETQLASWIFIKWFTSPEIMTRWDQVSNYFPTRVSTNKFLADYIAEKPQTGKDLNCSNTANMNRS
jgi:ABC-type glycerol-3-phosphate transport system substrate-binding protein